MESHKVTLKPIADPPGQAPQAQQPSLVHPADPRVSDVGAQAPTEFRTLTTHQVAEIIHYNISVVERMCREGRLPARRVGAKWIILADEFYTALKAGQGQPDFRRQTVMAKEGTKVRTASGKEVKATKKEEKPAVPAEKGSTKKAARSFGFQPVFCPAHQEDAEK